MATNSWDDFMIKVYEDAWEYIRYTYDVSNRMLWYAFSIITVIGTVASRLLVVGDGVQKAIEIRNPALMGIEERNVLVFIFLALFIMGLFIHAYYTFQRVIVDRQIRVINCVETYFIDQAKAKVELENYLYFRNIPIQGGTGDLIAQTRLFLPILINSLTGTLSLMMFFGIWWRDIAYILLVFFGLTFLQFISINKVGYKYLSKKVAPEPMWMSKLKRKPALHR